MSNLESNLQGGLHERAATGNFSGIELAKIAALTTAVRGIPLDRLEAICAAERDGQLVLLPCKVGDTVYAYEDTFCRIGAYRVDMVQLYGHSSVSFCANWHEQGELMADLDFDFDDIGKTVFLTPEAAEAAKEREQNV